MSSETPSSWQNLVDEAKRQTHICNSCRYCEGFCDVFPAMHQLHDIQQADLVKLANICHNCRGCYYACQYAEPHEFNVNIPKVFAALRQESWQKYTPFGMLQKFLSRHLLLWAVAIMLIGMLLLMAFGITANTEADNFYDIIPHHVMVNIFAPLFIIPYLLLGWGLVKFWRDIGGGVIRYSSFLQVIKDSARLKNLSGGHGKGCNFEKQDAFTHARKYAHHGVAYGFLLCFAATSSGTILHYGFDYPAPYPLLSPPKLLGVTGGVMMVVGTIWLLWLKFKADKSLGHQKHFWGEVGFIGLLFGVAASGLALYFLRDYKAVLAPLLYGHLALVALFFITTPFSKMSHAFFRFTALLQEKNKRF